MGKLRSKEAGFSAVEVVLVLVMVALIGAAGYIAYKSHSKTTTPALTDPYAGWKTYTSPLSSGLSFKYPADWSFTPPAQVFTNNAGGQYNDVTLYSVKPTTKPGDGAAVPTNQFMCVTFDEYGGTWQGNHSPFSALLSSDTFQSGGATIMLNTYKGGTPYNDKHSMQDIMWLITNPSNSNGNHYISTKNNYWVAVSAQFNCQQGGFPAGANLDADFNSQPETATAKLIMKSIQL